MSQPDARSLLNGLVVRHFGGRAVSVLEAGGGSRTTLDLAALNVADIATVDISPEQLERNTYAHQKILADLEDFTPTRGYDLIVVFNVLEHIPRADRALSNLAAACAEGGLIVVGGPSARALSGLVTRFTPHWFHVFFYRFVLGSPEAGKPGHPPFPTYFHPLSQPSELAAFLGERGFDSAFLALYEGKVYQQMRRHRPLLGIPLIALTWGINALTPKRYNARHGDFCAIFARRSAGAIGARPGDAMDEQAAAPGVARDERLEVDAVAAASGQKAFGKSGPG